MTYDLMDVYVDDKYLQYTLDYVCNSKNVNELHQLAKWYDPMSQPRNHVEWIYIYGILNAVKERLKELKSDQMDDDE